MKVVADAGPLMALGKIGGLDPLFRSYGKILTPPAVYDEVVTAGLAVGAPDAAVLEILYREKKLEVQPPTTSSLVVAAQLGRGEEESIRLAIEQQATWLLIDDLDARQAAIENFQAAGVSTEVKGTLGVIVSVHLDGMISQERAIELVAAIESRPDIWIRSDLCRSVIKALRPD